MGKVVFRASKSVNVLNQTLKDFATTSEANQWKIHKTGSLTATSNNQIFTIDHGLSYTPAYIAFWKSTFNTFYKWLSLGGANYIDSNILSIQLNNTGDQVTYIIFKDFGA